MEDTKSDYFVINYYKSNGDPYGGYHHEDCDKIEFYRYITVNEAKENKIKILETKLNMLKGTK
jgi:hypothetical protein